MAEIRPFRGLRYDPARVNPDDVLSPPYDVVGEAAEAALLARSLYNAAHVELAPGKPEGRFQRAAEAFQRWQDGGQLIRDEQPAFYLYEQEAPSRAIASAAVVSSPSSTSPSPRTASSARTSRRWRARARSDST